MKTIAIVGRPNGGKSTLFNRLIERREAIVDDESGITRDRHYGKSTWNGKNFIVIDTGGYVPNSKDIFEAAICEQIDVAIEAADIILFVLDVTTGITSIEDKIVQLLRKTKKQIVVVVNKVDNNTLIADVQSFYALGFKKLFPVSSMSGQGTGELLDCVATLLPQELPVEESTLPKIAIVGQPNVGKSSLLNLICEENRSIVTPIAGTTRDIIHKKINKFGLEFELVDTAGLRRRNKVKENVEFYANLRTQSAIEKADVCILMIDAQLGISQQDISIFNEAIEQGKGIVIAINKWDLVENKASEIEEFKSKILTKLAPFTDVPIQFISVLNKQRVIKTLETAIDIFKRRTTKVPTHKLNETILPFIEKHTHPLVRGRSIKIKFVNQLKSSRPLFSFYSNYPTHITEPYRRFLENKIRENFNFTGVPIKIIFKPK